MAIKGTQRKKSTQRKLTAILTGSFMARQAVVPGKTWEATFSLFGKVAVRFE